MVKTRAKKRQNPLTKKFIVQILSLILRGVNTNKKISIELNKDISTIAQQLEYLKDIKLLNLIDDKKRRYNEKMYEVNEEKLATLLLAEIDKKYNLKKSFVKFKDNKFIKFVPNKIILLRKNERDFEIMALLEIFNEAIDFFISKAKLLSKGNDIFKNYTAPNTKEENKVKSEFKKFLKLIHQKEEKIRKRKEQLRNSVDSFTKENGSNATTPTENIENKSGDTHQNKPLSTENKEEESSK
jgi:hypothetical protein